MRLGRASGVGPAGAAQDIRWDVWCVGNSATMSGRSAATTGVDGRAKLTRNWVSRELNGKEAK